MLESGRCLQETVGRKRRRSATGAEGVSPSASFIVFIGKKEYTYENDGSIFE